MQKKRILAAAACALMLLTACGKTIGSVTEVEVTTGTAATAAVTSAPEQTTVTSAETAAPVETTTAQTSASAAESSSVSEPAVIIPEKNDSSAPEDTADDKKGKKPSAGEIKEPYSNAYALYCVDDKELIAGKALDKRISLASTTKLLTASLALRYLDPGTVVTVGDEVYYAKPDSTLSYLLPWTEITVYDLIAAMLLPSGNDAAYVTAVNTARAAAGDPDMTIDDAVDYFCGLMNEFAAELGMEDSHFANPEGWDDSEHYTTVNDMLKLAEYVLTVPELCEITSDNIWYFYSPVSGDLIWNTTNLFLDPNSAYYRTDCIGIKTGTTADAGCCLVSAFAENDKKYICIVMGCNENEDRYELVNKILKKYLKTGNN